MKARDKLRVAICAANSSTGYSGGRYHTWAMAEAIASVGHLVTMWTNNIPIFLDDFADYPGHNSIQIDLSPGFETPPQGFFDVVVLVPDLGGNDGFYYNTLLLAKKSRARLVLLNFESPNWYNRYAPRPRDPRLWDNWMLASRYSDLILSLTKEGTKYAKDFYVKTQQQTRFEHFYPLINSLTADAIFANKQEPQIICITRFVKGSKHKGGFELLKALGPATRGNTLAIIVGTGEVEKAFKDALLDKALRFDVKVRWLYRLSDKQKFREIKNSKLMLFLSHFEGFGYPPVEAQYCNVPCIAYDLPVLREVNGDGLIYVPAGDESALQSVIACVLDGNYQPLVPLKEGIANVARFEKRVDEVDKILRGLVASPHKPAILNAFVIDQLSLLLAPVRHSMLVSLRGFVVKIGPQVRNGQQLAHRLQRTAHRALVRILRTTFKRSISLMKKMLPPRIYNALKASSERFR